MAEPSPLLRTGRAMAVAAVSSHVTGCLRMAALSDTRGLGALNHISSVANKATGAAEPLEAAPAAGS